MRGNGGQAPSFASLYESCAAVPPHLTFCEKMNPVARAILASFVAATAVNGEVIDVEGKGGAYYEVHLEKDGHHWFYIVPGNKPNGGSVAHVDGLKDGKPVFVCHNITNKQPIFWIKDAEKVRPDWRAFSFAVRLDLVDKLQMVQGWPDQGNTPGGTIIKTDLLALVEAAKRSGRFKDHTKLSEETDNAEQE